MCFLIAILYNEAKVTILDEPSAGMDPTCRYQIYLI